MTTEDKTKMKSEEQDNTDSKEVKEESPAVEKLAVEAIVDQNPTGTELQAAEDQGDEVKGEEVNPLMTTFTVVVPKEKILQDLNEAMVKYAAEIKLPGFRQGKIPVDVMRTRFKDAITDEVVNKIVEKAIFEKIDNEKMKIISRPEVMKLNYEEGQDLQAEIRVEVFPPIPLPDFETIEVEIPATELKFEPYDEEKQLNAVLEGNRRQTPVVSREIKDGDYVTYDFQSKILDTKKMTPRKHAHFHVLENEPCEIIDFYKDMLGKKIDDTFTITRTYPEDYEKKIWAGKEIEHHIKISSLFEMVKPEFNKDFLKTIGFEDEEIFKAKLKEEYEHYNTKHVEEIKLKFIIDKVSDVIQFPVPMEMVTEESKRLLSQIPPQGLDMKDQESLKVHAYAYHMMAERNIRFTFIMDAIKEEHKFEATSEELEKEYKGIAEANNVPVKEVRKYYLQKENAQKLREALLKNKVMDFLKEKVKIKEV